MDIEARIDQAQRMRQRGQTYAAIAEALGVSRTQARRYALGTTAWQEQPRGEPARRKAERQAKVLKMRRLGKPISFIAVILKVSEATVRADLRAREAPARPPSPYERAFRQR